MSDMFPDALRKANVERQIDAVRVCVLWAEIVRERLSPEIAVHSSALSYDEHRKVLVVGASSAAVSCELQFALHVLKKEMHLRLGRRDVIDRVVLKIVGT